MQAYIDDSASDFSEDKRLVLAGYIHTKEAWKDFSREWAQALAAPRHLSALHMSARFPQFTKRERDQKIDDLVGVLEKYQPVSFEVVVSRKEYNEHVKPVGPHYLRHTYFPCFIGVLHAVAKTANACGLSGPIDLIFDDQGQIGNEVASWYPFIKQADPNLALLGNTMAFENDLAALPLQAADFLAWHVRRCAEAKCSPRERQVADAIRFTHAVSEVPPELFRRWGKEIPLIPGIEDARDKISTNDVKAVLDALSSQLPPERLIPAIDEIQRRAEMLARLKKTLLFLRMGWLWNWIAKGTFKVGDGHR